MMPSPPQQLRGTRPFSIAGYVVAFVFFTGAMARLFSIYAIASLHGLSIKATVNLLESMAHASETQLFEGFEVTIMRHTFSAVIYIFLTCWMISLQMADWLQRRHA